MTKGFIRLPRAFFDTVDWQQKRKFTPTEAWVDLVRRAHFDTEPATLVCATTTITYGYGEQCASISFLSKAWQWSEKTVRNFLDRLQRSKLIAIRQTGGRLPNVIRILNGDEPRSETPSAHPRTASRGRTKNARKVVHTPSQSQTQVRPAATTPVAVRPLWPEVKNPGLPAGFGLENPPETLYVLSDDEAARRHCTAVKEAAAPTAPAYVQSCEAPKEYPKEVTQPAPKPYSETDAQRGTVNPLSVSEEEYPKGTQADTQPYTQRDTKEATETGNKNKNKEIEEKKYITPHVVMYNESPTPTLAQVQTYCQQNALNAIDPQRFYDYYTARGWRVGQSPMTDWHAAARYWNRRDAERTSRSAVPSVHAPRNLYDLKQQANREALMAYRQRCALRQTQSPDSDLDF